MHASSPRLQVTQGAFVINIIYIHIFKTQILKEVKHIPDVMLNVGIFVLGACS